MGNKLPYLNVGCGYSFHKDWTNIDFSSTGEDVIAHNLLNGIPYADESFEVVYHSHVLEHFSKNDGKKFIGECYRVLKREGILRIGVPDLQKIIQEYTSLLSELKERKNDPYLNACYDWILMELYDQTLRNNSGGNMVEFLSQSNLINEDFILQRCGYEVKEIIDAYRKIKDNNSEGVAMKPLGIIASLKKNISRLNSLPHKLRNFLRTKIIGREHQHYYELGKFRSSGEIHQWMYDEHSLKRLLSETGFKHVGVCSAFESKINQWEKFGLEIIEGNVRKPDSLFMEATK